MSDKRPGRPRNEHPSASVHVKLSAPDYDRVYRLARQERVSVPEILRRGVTRLVATTATSTL